MDFVTGSPCSDYYNGLWSKKMKAMTPGRLALMFIVVFVFPLLPVLISGDWAWREAWVYALASTVGFIVSRVLAVRHHPDILEERARSIELEGAKSWDKILAPSLAFGNLIILALAGLDHLFGWTTPFPLAVKILAFIVILFGYWLGSWALIENRFFSGVVRIQKDRDHRVVSSGPYRFIRHPGYAGAFWAYLFTPLLLDSVWAFIPTVLLVGILVLRTALEDSTLQQELPGYREFTQKTSYRLFPGLW
jgi:protein-S-isoprenylcysteine O-methyltransferase Ste14